MSNPPPQHDPGPAEPCATVFARIADVPVDAVDKFIASTEAVYTDLNQVLGHPYWGDLVLHQGAAVRALREARESLEALRAEAVGARNTELGVTVATAVIDGERHYAQNGEDKIALVERALRPRADRSACHLYVWDRPYENDAVPGPYQQIRIVTDVEEQVGVLNYTEEADDGELRSWHTLSPSPISDVPVLKFDTGSALAFPRDAVLRWDDLRAALIEFVDEGLRPGCVEWQKARWGE